MWPPLVEMVLGHFPEKKRTSDAWTNPRQKIQLKVLVPFYDEELVCLGSECEAESKGDPGPNRVSLRREQKRWLKKLNHRVESRVRVLTEFTNE